MDEEEVVVVVVVEEEEEEENIGRRRGPWSHRLRVRVCLFGCAAPRRDDGVKRARYSPRRVNGTSERAARRGAAWRGAVGSSR